MPKTVMRFFADALKSGALINFARGDQDALGPQRDLAVAALARKADAFAHQSLAKPLAAPARIDQQQPQFCNLVGLPDQKHRADRLAVDLGDPAMFARVIE